MFGFARQSDRDTLVKMLARQLELNPQQAEKYYQITWVDDSSFAGFKDGDPKSTYADFQQMLRLTKEVYQMYEWFVEKSTR